MQEACNAASRRERSSRPNQCRHQLQSWCCGFALGLQSNVFKLRAIRIASSQSQSGQTDGSNPRVDDRRVLNGIFWVLRSGAPWRDLPAIYGPRTTCYNRFVRWRRAGVWDRIMEALAAPHEAAVQMIDTSVVRVHQHGACIAENRDQHMGRSRGGLAHRRTADVGREEILSRQPTRTDGPAYLGRHHQSTMDLRAGPSATERRARPRPLRGTILARPSSSCAHDNDRVRLPPASPPRKSEAGKKESTGHHLNQACQPCATPSPGSSFDCHLSDARAAEDGSARNHCMNESAKVVLILIGWNAFAERPPHDCNS